MPESKGIDERPWPEVAVAILRDIDYLKRAEANHYSALKSDIADLRSDFRVHKIKTGFVASISAGLTVVVVWVLSIIKGGG